MAERSIEDRLREEYFDLLPKMVRVAQSFTTEIECLLRLYRNDLASHENLVVKTRVKDCASAIDKLRQLNVTDPSAARNPGGVFDRDRPDLYSLLLLRDLVGVRILVFPSKRAAQVDTALHGKFRAWKADPIFEGGQRLAYKYHGLRKRDGVYIPCEYQIASTLVGLFWEVEHSAIYKQSPNLKGLAPLLKDQTSAVYAALMSFEAEFEQQIENSDVGNSKPSNNR
jgi:hypothetical protein